MKPVVGAILPHPALYRGPRMVKPPIVHTAGLLRRIGAGITTTAWAWIGQLSGQQLFYPPNVAGWDDTRWLDTATFRGRWIGVQQILGDKSAARPVEAAPKAITADAACSSSARSSSGTTRLSAPAPTYQLQAFAKRALDDAGKPTGSRSSTR